MAQSSLPFLVEAGESVAESDCDMTDLALLCLQVVPTDAAMLPV